MPSAANDDVPDFGNRRRPARDVAGFALSVAPFAAILVFDRSDKAVFICELHAFGFAVCALIIALERPIRAWLEVLHARAVVKGVAALEAKVSARE